MSDWDNSSWFTLHDYNGDGEWQVDEIMRTGLLASRLKC